MGKFTTIFITASTVLSLIFTSCSKEEKTFVPTPENSTTLNFEIGYLTSDKPAEQISPTKDFEDAITTMKVWIFQGTNDDAVFSRDLTVEEIKAMKATFSIPKVTAGEKLTIMTIANLATINTTSKKRLLEVRDDNPSRYNSNNYNDMITKSIKIEGFTMWSKDELTVNSESTYTLKNKLEKNVSKIEIIMDNKFMREENENKGEGYEGFFKAEYLTMLSNECSTQIFGTETQKAVVDVKAAAIQPSEFISQGIGYFCYKPSNSFSFNIEFKGIKKISGSLNSGEGRFIAQYNSTILPNKHYIIKCTTTGNDYDDVTFTSTEVKDWVKTNN